MHREYLGLVPQIEQYFRSWKQQSAALIKANTLILTLEEIGVSDREDNVFRAYVAYGGIPHVYFSFTGDHDKLESILSKIKARFNCTFDSEVSGSEVQYLAKEPIWGCKLSITHYPTDCEIIETTEVREVTVRKINCGGID